MLQGQLSVSRRPLVLLAVLGALVSTTGPARAATRCAAGARHAGPQICAARDRRASDIVVAVHRLARRYRLNAVVFGVWRDRREVVTGAIGPALPGIPARRDSYMRIGNTTESFTTTLLLQLAQDGRIRLSDRVSRWFPRVRNARKVTVGMLASSTSGYADYTKVESFRDAFHADVFRHWTPRSLIDIGTRRKTDFTPGRSWKFSDTGFVLLGEILARVGHAPVERQIERRILRPLGLRHTRMTTTAAVPSPALHGYTDERGPWEDATFWNPSWATYTGNMTSRLSDLRTWARAVGTGRLLSRRSHTLQTGPQNVGLGKLTKSFHYGMGVAVANSWLIAGAPGLLGYRGIVAYLPRPRATVVIFTTVGRHSPPGTHYAGAIFNAVGRIAVPSRPPTFPAG
jgi:CubicO group peptidase (beta-lactamase class C family)